MLSKIVYRIFAGLGFTCLITFVSMTNFIVQDTEVTFFQFWLYMLSNMIMGVYFGVSSLIFEIEDWSFLKQLTVHFVLSAMLWFLIAIFIAGWIPFTPLSILISFCVFVGVYMLVLLGFSAYYKKIVNDMNESVK